MFWSPSVFFFILGWFGLSFVGVVINFKHLYVRG